MRAVGDRRGLFSAVAEWVGPDVGAVLYPGSYVDLTPSVIWPDVTYVDSDRRARRFFADEAGVQELLVEHGAGLAVRAGSEADPPVVRFIHSDYSHDLPIEEQSAGLLVSLYAGFVSEHCTRYLRPGGFLLVNPSHGDAAMASIDVRYELHGVIVATPERYRVDTDELDTYLVPKRDIEITVDSLHDWGRAIAYTRSPFAYLFQRIA